MDFSNDENVSSRETNSDFSRPRARTGRLGWLVLLLCFLVALALIPSLAERWAYSTARGVERAKLEAAKQFLADCPESVESARTAYVAKLVEPSVVGVKTSLVTDQFFGSVAEGQGSGVIVDPKGFIVTNFHVICEGGRLVDGVEIVLSDGRSVSEGIRLVGYDEKLDVAVLRIEAENLSALEWGDSDALEVGAGVIAVGNPYGLARTVTKGIVSAKERFVYDERGVVSQEFLQTDAAVNPGNSGGALVDEQGRLVGINTAIFGQQYQGISFALPSNRVRAVYEEILRESPVARD
ncbi:MAG: trypsin-like peptidase domain-containing protein [Thermoguttaceae bacterium]|nr:trypsin-like peptidase domain-containing protein [Thermoguttaceae bacterium]